MDESALWRKRVEVERRAQVGLAKVDKSSADCEAIAEWYETRPEWGFHAAFWRDQAEREAVLA